MKTAVLSFFAIILSINLFAQHTTNKIVQFPYDSYELTSEALNTLQNCINLLQDSSYSEITIIGHTDSDGSDSFNMDLSHKRAQSVLDYFLSKGISKERFTIQFFGEAKPISDNENDPHKQLNRRVEIIMKKGNPGNPNIEKQAQIFTFSPNQDTILHCTEGTIIKINANSFVSKRNEKAVLSSIRFSVTEFYKL